MNERNDVIEIDLQKLLMAYLRRWWLIVLSALIVAGGALAYAYFLVDDLYQASATIYVNNIKEGATVDSLTTGNLNASQQLVSTYINIVESDRVLDKAAQKLGNHYTAADIRKIVTASQVKDTEIFAIKVTCRDPEEAARVANTLADVVPDAIGALIEGSSARVIDDAKVPGHRCSPSYTKYTVIGGLAGGILAAAYLTILFLLDVRIKDEEELTALFDLPVLGQIPEFVSASKAPSYGMDAEAEKTAATETENSQERGEDK